MWWVRVIALGSLVVAIVVPWMAFRYALQAAVRAEMSADDKALARPPGPVPLAGEMSASGW